MAAKEINNAVSVSDHFVIDFMMFRVGVFRVQPGPKIQNNVFIVQIQIIYRILQCNYH